MDARDDEDHPPQSPVEKLMRVSGHLVDFDGSIEHFADGLHLDVISVAMRMSFPGHILVKLFGNILREVIPILRHVIHA